MAGPQKPGHSAADEKMIDTTPWRKNSESINWDTLRHEWVTTNISIVGLAEKYELSVSAVRNHYNRYNWKDELRKFHNMVEEAYETALENKAKEIVDRAVELDAVILKASEQIASIIENQVNELTKELEDEDNQGSMITRLDEISKTLKIASETLKNSHYNIRLASDRATSIVKEDENTIRPLSEDENERIDKELGIIGNNKEDVKKELSKQK